MIVSTCWLVDMPIIMPLTYLSHNDAPTHSLTDSTEALHKGAAIFHRPCFVLYCHSLCVRVSVTLITCHTRPVVYVTYIYTRNYLKLLCLLSQLVSVYNVYVDVRLPCHAT